MGGRCSTAEAGVEVKVGDDVSSRRVGETANQKKNQSGTSPDSGAGRVCGFIYIQYLSGLSQISGMVSCSTHKPTHADKSS